MGSIIILRVGTDFLLVGVFGAVSKHSPRPLSASSLCFKPRMPIRRSGTEQCRATPASGVVSLAFTASRAPRPSGESPSRIASGIFRRKPSICPSRIRSRLCSRSTARSRNHPVPWLPARCLRHHRGPQPVEVRHWHVYFASTCATAQTAMASPGAGRKASCSTHLQGHLSHRVKLKSFPRESIQSVVSSNRPFRPRN